MADSLALDQSGQVVITSTQDLSSFVVQQQQAINQLMQQAQSCIAQANALTAQLQTLVPQPSAVTTATS